MSISFPAWHRYPKRRLVSEYQHCYFIRLSKIYPWNFAIHFNVKMSVLIWESFIVECNRNNGNNGIVKSVTQNCASQRCNNIPLCALCFFDYFYMLTQSFSVLKSFCRKCKKIDIWQTNTARGLIFSDLDAVYGSDDGLKKKFT